MAMAGGSLAAYMQGRLSLKDFEWPQSLRPALPFNDYLNSHLIPEIDLRALLSCACEGAGCGSDSPNGKLDDSKGAGKVCTRCGSSEHAAASREHALLLEAATTCGFFQVHNHSIPISALETLNFYARKFFSMPLEHKLEIAKLLGDLIAGYNFNSGYMCGSPVDSPNKFWSEAVRVSSTSDKRSISALARCLWPEEADQQAFGDALEECSKGFMKLSEQLALILLRELDIDAEEVLSENVTGEYIGLKLNHYPPCPQPDMTLGLPVHSDLCLITLLWQDDVGGLQVQRDGQWISVKPRHDALVFNIGDILQVWSNDRFKTGVHRAVLNTIQSRYSIGFFYNPSGDSMLAPLPQLLKKTGEHPKFKRVQYSEYRRIYFARIFQDEWQGVDYLRC